MQFRKSIAPVGEAVVLQMADTGLETEGINSLIAVRPPNMNRDKPDAISDLAEGIQLLTECWDSVLWEWARAYNIMSTRK